MIKGEVNERLEAILPLTIIGPLGDRTIQAIVDTGYNGWLTLPLSVISELGLEWLGNGNAVLADGSRAVIKLYQAIAL